MLADGVGLPASIAGLLALLGSTGASSANGAKEATWRSR